MEQIYPEQGSNPWMNTRLRVWIASCFWKLLHNLEIRSGNPHAENGKVSSLGGMFDERDHRTDFLWKENLLWISREWKEVRVQFEGHHLLKQEGNGIWKKGEMLTFSNHRRHFIWAFDQHVMEYMWFAEFVRFVLPYTIPILLRVPDLTRQPTKTVNLTAEANVVSFMSQRLLLSLTLIIIHNATGDILQHWVKVKQLLPLVNNKHIQK